MASYPYSLSLHRHTYTPGRKLHKTVMGSEDLLRMSQEGWEGGDPVRHTPFHYRLPLWTSPAQSPFLGTSHAQSLPPDLSPTALCSWLSFTCSYSLPNINPHTPTSSTHTKETKCPSATRIHSPPFRRKPFFPVVTARMRFTSDKDTTRQNWQPMPGDPKSRWVLGFEMPVGHGKMYVKTTRRDRTTSTRATGFKVS